MIHYKKTALVYSYGWKIIHPKKHVVIYGREDIVLRNNGFCVIEFTNRFMHVHGLIRLQNFRKIEWMIFKYMPASIEQREEMEQWLRSHWHLNFCPNY